MGVSFNNRSGKNRRNRQPGFSEINITPMVDVMLVLLVIFMVAAPMMTTGVTVDLPKADSPPVPGHDEPLTVSVKADGKIYLQEKPVSAGELQTRLKAIAAQKKDSRIFVHGDGHVNYEKIMQVVGEVNGAGFTKIALITDTGNTPAVRGK